MQKRPSLLPEGAEAGLFFFDGQYQFVSREGGRDQMRYIGPDSVREAFSAERIDSGWLGAEILRTGRTVAGPFCVAFIAAARREIVIALDDEPESLVVPVPPLIAVGDPGGLHLVAVRENAFRPDAKAFYPPFPNLFADARVCWGANRQPPTDHARILAAVDLFFSSPFNQNEAARRSRSAPANVVTKLRELARRRTRAYPADDLVAIHPATTVAKLVDRLVSGRTEGVTWG